MSKKLKKHKLKSNEMQFKTKKSNKKLVFTKKTNYNYNRNKKRVNIFNLENDFTKLIMEV